LVSTKEGLKKKHKGGPPAVSKGGWASKKKKDTEAAHPVVPTGNAGGGIGRKRISPKRTRRRGQDTKHQPRVTLGDQEGETDWGGGGGKKRGGKS